MSFNAEDLPPLRDVIRDHNLRAEKSLGQNFLLDQNITDKIARQCGDVAGKTVIEIGPGPGGLTRSLLKTDAKHVIAVEFDERAVAALQGLQEAADGRLSIIHGDALKVNVAELCEGPRVIAANLPYNIATPLLTGWLKQIHETPGVYDEMVLMFQKEVADRIAAQVNTKAYGRLSVISQWICDARSMFDLPPTAFTPPPKVKSSVVRFVPKALDAGGPAFKAVEMVTAAAFGQRRKMIRSSLKDYTAHFEACGLDSTRRAETLMVAEFVKLARQA